MRTTLILNDDLVQAAKKRAAERQTSLSALVNEALRESLKAPQRQKPQAPYRVATFSPKQTPKVDTSPAEIYDLLVAEDKEPCGS